MKVPQREFMPHCHSNDILFIYVQIFYVQLIYIYIYIEIPIRAFVPLRQSKCLHYLFILFKFFLCVT